MAGEFQRLPCIVHAAARDNNGAVFQQSSFLCPDEFCVSQDLA